MPSYFEQRLASLGITPEINTIPRFTITDKDGVRTYTPEEKKPNCFFEAQVVDDPAVHEGTKETGNILINYFEPTGKPYTYVKPGTVHPRPFSRTRVAKPEKGQGKYLSPKGAKLAPFFTPKVIDAYQNQREIETLVAVEGEFKAFKMDMLGIHAVGLPGIQGFYSGEIAGELHWNIVHVIRDCKVKNIIYLTDADTFTINYEKDKDLAKRPASFHSAIQNFTESLQGLLSDKDVALEKIYFYAIRESFNEHGHKGFDDLVTALPVRAADIVKELLESHGTPSEFFEAENLTAWHLTSKKLYKRFGLTKAEDFYSIYGKKFIGDRPFLYKGIRYEFDGEKVKYIKHDHADRYLRVGPDWFKEVMEPMGEDRKVTTIAKWKVTEIQRDYKKFPDFMDQIARYDGFTVEPKWIEGYRRKIGEFFNLMNPLEHSPKAGEFPATLKFLKHIFQGKATVNNHIISDTFTVALDWLTVLHQHPMHMLPVIILLSEEQGTGKTTFMDWLTMIYGSNAIIMNNETFKMNFNAHYASKFLLMVDEGMIEVEKKAEKERLKQLATGKEMLVQFKGADIKRIPYYGKLVIASNDADRVMKMEEDDTRWFVVKVPVIPKGDKDPLLMEKLKEEIPAWLDFISKREIFHPKIDRLWFSPDNFITDQFKIIVQQTRSRLEKLIDNFIKETFLNFRHLELKIPANHLTKLLNDKAKFRTEDNDVREYLKKKGLETQPTQRFVFPIDWKPSALTPEQFEIEYLRSSGRVFIFRVEEWLSEAEMKEFNTPLVIGQEPKKTELQLSIEAAKKDEAPW